MELRGRASCADCEGGKTIVDRRPQLLLPPKYWFFASMNPGTNTPSDFDRSYDEHVARLSSVPGVVLAARAWQEPGRVTIGGESHPLPSGPAPTHLAAYALDSPSVLTSDEWAHAVDAGPWAQSTRGRTSERGHTLFAVASCWAGGSQVRA